MKNFHTIAIVLLVVIVLLLFFTQSANKENKRIDNAANSLLVLWSTGNADTVENMVFMYTLNAKKQQWFDDIVLLIWGESQQLTANDPKLQKHIKKMQDAGIRIIACQACAANFNVIDQLKALDIEVFYTGQFLTEWLKSDKKILTF